jgi:repressor LexA
MKKLIISEKEKELIRHIRNYITHQDKNPSFRYLMKIMNYKSPRSISLMIDNLLKNKILQKDINGLFKISKEFEQNNYSEKTVDIPLIGNVSCGLPIFAEENVESVIPVSTKLAKPQYKYFFLKAVGDSMNKKGINPGDFVLVRQQNSANSGDIIVALIDNEATIKEIQILNNVILLKPHSTNPEHKPIVLSSDFLIQGLVITSIRL